MAAECKSKFLFVPDLARARQRLGIVDTACAVVRYTVPVAQQVIINRLAGIAQIIRIRQPVQVVITIHGSWS